MYKDYYGGMGKMGVPNKKENQRFTYIDYSSWPDDERWELIEGIAYNMSPAPSWKHQELSMELSFRLKNHIRTGKCKVFAAPFDVLLPTSPVENDGEIDTVVQPDISVICDPGKKTEKGCLGAPDLIMEILSPSTSKKDLNEKFHLYEKHGVREYWIVDPGNRYIQVFHLKQDDGKESEFDEGTLVPPADWREKNEIAESQVLKGFQINVKELFDSLD